MVILETINQVKKRTLFNKPMKSNYTTFVHSKGFNIETGEQIIHDIPDYNDASLFYTKSGIFK